MAGPMTGAGSDSSDPIAALIQDITATERNAAVGEIELIRKHVASAGFDPSAVSRAGMLLDGLTWQGRTITSRDRLPTDQVHYLRHVVVRQEWPAETSPAGYVADLQEAVLDREGGIYLERYFGVWELTFVSPSGARRGPGGAEWILVGYEVDYGFWVTGFQPREGLEYVLYKPDRTEGQWLRHPR